MPRGLRVIDPRSWGWYPKAYPRRTTTQTAYRISWRVPWIKWERPWKFSKLNESLKTNNFKFRKQVSPTHLQLNWVKTLNRIEKQAELTKNPYNVKALEWADANYVWEGQTHPKVKNEIANLGHDPNSNLDLRATTLPKTLTKDFEPLKALFDQ